MIKANLTCNGDPQASEHEYVKNTVPWSDRVDQAVLLTLRSFPLWYRAVSKLLRFELALESQWSLCFLFYSGPPLIRLHPLGVYVVLGPLANAALGEGGKPATAVGSRRLLVNPYGHSVLALPSVSCADLLEGDKWGWQSGWELTQGSCWMKNCW